MSSDFNKLNKNVFTDKTQQKKFWTRESLLTLYIPTTRQSYIAAGSA